MRDRSIKPPVGERDKSITGQHTTGELTTCGGRENGEPEKNRTGKKGNSGAGETVGSRLKYYRHLRGRSQDWLAEKLVTTRQQIWLYEKGKAFPTSDVIENICKLLYITPNELFGDVREKDGAESDALEAHITRVTEFAREEYERLRAAMKR